MALKLDTLREADLRHWNLLRDFRTRLAEATRYLPIDPSLEDPKRKLYQAEYLSLFLFGLLNPVVRTMQGLCAASHLERVQKEVCLRPVSVGSFSDMQHLIAPDLLDKVFGPLVQQVSGPSPPEDPRLSARTWLAQDGSLWRALPRMAWAIYGVGRPAKDKAKSRGVKLHLSFNLLEDKPQRMVLTEGRRCERAVWKEHWQRGDAYVGDRYFGEDYKLLAQLTQKHCAYVLRLREQSVITVETELPVSAADRQAGVTRQAWARLGTRNPSPLVRVVWVQGLEEELILVTNLGPEELPAELVSLLYRKRWQVELFFRWVKCILHCGHWLAEGPNGVKIQIYLALIASLLFQLFLGQRPTKRMMELVQFFFLGVASPEELSRGLQKELQRLEVKKRRA